MPATGSELPQALILCGGLGTRLRSVLPDTPKGLAEVAGRPFLDILTDELVHSGVRRFVLCTGYGAEQIAAHFGGRRDAEFLISAEDRPLGTGGAVAHALPRVAGDAFFVVNGDSFCRVSYRDLLDAHLRRGALISVVATPAIGRTDVGAIAVDVKQRIVEFSEKPGSVQGTYVNAGIYAMQREAMALAPGSGAFSLERDLFPRVVQAGRCYAFPAEGPLIDIGTPDRLRMAQEQFR